MRVAVSPNSRRPPCQQNPFIVVENRSVYLERDLSAMRVKNIRRSGILSLVDFPTEEERARTYTYLQHSCARLLIMELPRRTVCNQIHHGSIVVPNRRLWRSGLRRSLRACHRDAGNECNRCNGEIDTDHGRLSSGERSSIEMRPRPGASEPFPQRPANKVILGAPWSKPPRYWHC